MTYHLNITTIMMHQGAFNSPSTYREVDYDQFHDDVLADSGLGDIDSYTPIIDGVNPITGDLFVRYDGQRQSAFPISEINLAFTEGWEDEDGGIPVSDEAWITLLDIAQAGADVNDHIPDRVMSQFAIALAKRAGFVNPTEIKMIPITTRSDGSILFRFWGVCTKPENYTPPND